MNQKSIIPYFFVLFIVGYMTLDFFFIYLSNITYNGVVTEHAYEKGLQYNSIIDKNIEQEHLGWVGSLDYQIKDGKHLLLKFTLKDAKGKKISGALINAKIMRPVTDKFDKLIILEEVAVGEYQVRCQLPLAGQWEIKLTAKAKGKEYFLNKRIII
jgi:nitrogen fixation protein FixH